MSIKKKHYKHFMLFIILNMEKPFELKIMK